MTEFTKTDCFAYVAKSCDCNALTARICDFGECPFYKTQMQFDIDAVHTVKLTGQDAKEIFLKMLKKYKKQMEPEQFYLLKGQAMSGRFGRRPKRIGKNTKENKQCSIFLIC